MNGLALKEQGQQRVRHGHSKGYSETATYRTWKNMVSRCVHRSRADFSYYGGRGISVCAAWRSFPNFLKDMGERPLGMTLDRIDSNGNYEPGNCKWATRQEQSENQRHVIWIEHNGQRKTVCQWADAIGMSRAAFSVRYKKGWRGEKLFAPPMIRSQETTT